MRNWKVWALVAIGLGSFTACSDDDDATGENIITVSPQTTRSILQNGTWKVDHFKIGDIDQTSNYELVELEFMSLGVLSIQEDQTTHTGLWAVSNDTDITPGTNLNAPEIEITVNGSDLINLLADDWDIRSISESEINLEDNEGNVTYHLRLKRTE